MIRNHKIRLFAYPAILIFLLGILLVGHHLIKPKHDLQKEAYYAIRSSNSHRLAKCIKKGLDVNGSIGIDLTPLLLSTTMRKEKITLLLIQNGADVFIANSNGVTPFMQLARYCSINLMGTLFIDPEKINLTDWEGQTALDYAVLSGNAKALIFILDAGGTPGEKDVYWDRAISFLEEIGDTNNSAYLSNMKRKRIEQRGRSTTSPQKKE